PLGKPRVLPDTKELKNFHAQTLSAFFGQFVWEVSGHQVSVKFECADRGADEDKIALRYDSGVVVLLNRFPMEAMLEIFDYAILSLSLLDSLANDRADLSATETRFRTLLDIRLPERRLVRAYERFAADMLRDTLRSDIVGHEEALRFILDTILHDEKDARTGTRNFFLPGASGIGKTFIAQSLAKALGGYFEVFPLGNYTNESDVNALFGSPEGYIGSKNGSALGNAIRKGVYRDHEGALELLKSGQKVISGGNALKKLDPRAAPYIVLLFDEVEKAHSSIFNALLSFTDSVGTIRDTLSVEQLPPRVICFFTSNVVTKYARDVLPEALKATIASVQRQGQSVFSEPFLNRMTIVAMHPLAPAEVLKLTEMTMERIIAKKQKLYRDRSKLTVTIRMDEPGEHLLHEIVRKRLAFGATGGGRQVGTIISEIFLALDKIVNEFVEKFNSAELELPLIAIVNHNSNASFRSLISKEEEAQIFEQARSIGEGSITSDDMLPIKKVYKRKDILISIQSRVVGQDEAIGHVLSKIVLHVNSSKSMPLSIFVTGPTGVGKTEFARALGACFGTETRILSMERYQTREAAASFLGSSKGYVDSDKGGDLQNALRTASEKAPDAVFVLVLDEVEKAEKSIYQSLLHFLETGHISDARGVVTTPRSTIILMTSNAVLQSSTQSEDLSKAETLLRAELVSRQFFAPEFLGRIGSFAMFKPLSSEARRDIIARTLMSSLISSFNLLLKELNQEVLLHIEDAIAEKVKQSGARAIEREVLALIEPSLLDILENDDPRIVRLRALKGGAPITIRLSSGSIVVSLAPEVLKSAS
ncbi:MAG: AAA family ATPase, partial [Proteobacteria bacterium]